MSSRLIKPFFYNTSRRFANSPRYRQTQDWLAFEPKPTRSLLLSPDHPLFCRSISTAQDPTSGQQSQDLIHGQKPKKLRSPAGKTSLRRAAVEAQRSRDGILQEKPPTADIESETKTVTACCAAEKYDIANVARILRNQGYDLDPCHTKLYPQVVHVRMPVQKQQTAQKASEESGLQIGDVFIFPSGTIVAWAISEESILSLASTTLLPAAQGPHIDQLETENLDYIEDSERENSSIKGDTIVLGTKAERSPEKDPKPDTQMRRDADTVLAKIAFSSGLARSTKLAVLERLLSDYFESTRSIPTMLSKGSRLPFTRSFVLQKTGQLLSIRAQLNLYSELTDSLPDLFWDSRHELGLEGYYDQVGRALDVGIRIKILNEKMDYSQEIASILREQLSANHSFRLEWIIIVLIGVEIGFEVRRIWEEQRKE